MTKAVELAQVASTGVSEAFKNRIINGAMVIDQRNAGASVTPTNNTYNIDRWKAYLTQASKFTVQQNAGSITPPAGFINYLGATSSAATSLGASDYFLIAQAIEGLNVADLGWGTANAQTVTLSFWVRSSLTGTFGGAFGNNAGNRAYPFSYTISAANTWEYKTITVTGDTTGTWLTTTSTGIIIYWSLGTGSSLSGTAGAWAANGNLSVTGATSVVGTNGATFYITGVQLEVGSTATSFDYRPYGTELALCQRYYYKALSDTQYGFFGVATLSGANNGAFYIPFPVSMRAIASSINYSSLMTSDYISGFSAAISAASISGVTSRYVGVVDFTATGAGSTGQFKQILANNNTAAYIAFNSEL